MKVCPKWLNKRIGCRAFIAVRSFLLQRSEQGNIRIEREIVVVTVKNLIVLEVQEILRG